MSAPVGVGDWVECIDARPFAWTGCRVLQLGAIYRVRDIVLSLAITGDLSDALLLDGIHHYSPRHIKECAFAVDRFRPIYRRRDGAFDHLLTPVDLGVDDGAERVHALSSTAEPVSHSSRSRPLLRGVG